MERLINGACGLLFNLLHFATSIPTPGKTFPGTFQSVTDRSNAEGISPLPSSPIWKTILLFSRQTMLNG